MTQIRERLNRARREEGLTIIEISVAIGIFAVVMILLTTMLGTSLRNILQGKQRSVATTDAEQLLEAARNVDFANLGHDASDTFDPSDEPGLVQNSSGDYEYTTDNSCGDSTEPLAFVGTPDPVFAPHVRQPNPASDIETQLTRYVYVTEVDEDCDPATSDDARRVIVRSVFANPGNPGASDEVRLQTIISSAGSLPSTFPPLSGMAQATGSSATIRLTDDLGTDVNDSLNMNRSVTDSRVVSVARVHCTSTLPSISGSTSAGGGTASATADNDTSDGTHGTSDGPNSTSGSFTVGSPYESTTVSSDASCSADAPLPSSSALPAGGGSSTTAQATTIDYDPSGLGLPSALGLSNLISVLETSNAAATTDTEQTEGTPGQRPTREIEFEATSSQSDVTVLGGSTDDLNFSQGLVHVTPHTIRATARANAGLTCQQQPPQVPCSGDATVDVGGGFDIRIFDPSGNAAGCDNHTGTYCVIEVRQSDLASLTGKSRVSATADASVSSTKVMTSVDVSFDGPTNNPQTKTFGGWRYEQAFRPASATARLLISSGNVRVLDVEVVLDIGEVLARACQGTASGASGCL